jgi:transcriptional regulator with XRE-family HTH domain
MTFAARIRRARLLASLSQTELGQHLNLTRSAISQWERFSGSKPKLDHLAKLATLCKVQFEWLSTGRGAMKLGDTHQEPAAHMAEFAFDEQESRLLIGFRQLTGRKKDAIVDLVERIKR